MSAAEIVDGGHDGLPKVSSWLDLEFWKPQYYCKRTDQIVRNGSLGKIYRADGMFESGRS
jgi:hypothetical protein